MKRCRNSHGPTARERQMIALQEEGWGFADVARHLGLNAHYVRARLVELSGEESREDISFWQMIRQGSAQLGARIEAVHGRRL